MCASPCPLVLVMNISPRPSHWSHWLATGFGSGLVPWIPGTVGTITAIPLYLLLQPNWVIYTLVLVGMMGFGPWICARTAKDFGGADTENIIKRLKLATDHQAIVWDEWVGLLITLWTVPFTVKSLLLGFVLFRFFDMVKPWPIYWFDRHVHGGVGTMLDDVLAGVGAAVSLHYLLPYWP